MHSLVFPPDANSNAYIFADLARGLLSLGHEVIVLTTTPHYAIDEESLQRQPMTSCHGRWLLKSDYHGIRCFHVAVPSRKGGIKTRITTALRFHALGLIVMLSRKFKCEVVLSQSPPLTIGLVSAWIARWHGAKSVFIAQDIFPDGLVRQGKIRNPWFIKALRTVEHLVYRQSDAICSISDGLVDVLRLRVPSRTLLRKIPNFVNTEIYRPLDRDNAFAKERELGSQFVVSYVGNLGNAQDFTPVLAAAEVCSDLPIKFLIAGSGIKQEWLAQELAARKLDNVILLGYVPRDKTPLINAASDICLVLLAPHILNFSFPSKIYTIMACGKPTLLYGHTEADVALFVEKESIGWVVRNGDIEGFVRMVRYLYHNRTELKVRGSRALACATSHFTEKAVALQYDALIKELVTSR